VAVKIKLKRMGKIREPYYRIVVADARTKRDGRAIEEIGKYHPKLEPSLIEVNSDRVQHWLSVGAQPTDPVRHLLTITGDWQKFKGEPGQEGTLKVAEPKADKKDRYEALVKESFAAKETKESKGGKKESARSGSRPKKADAAKSDAAKADGAKADGAKADSAKVDGAKVDGAKAEEAKADDVKADAVKAEETKAEETKAEETKAEETKAADTTAEAAKPAETAQAEPAASGDGASEA
jgi:small subunit ribosomal protein S16